MSSSNPFFRFPRNETVRVEVFLPLITFNQKFTSKKSPKDSRSYQRVGGNCVINGEQKIVTMATSIGNKITNLSKSKALRDNAVIVVDVHMSVPNGNPLGTEYHVSFVDSKPRNNARFQWKLADQLKKIREVKYG